MIKFFLCKIIFIGIKVKYILPITAATIIAANIALLQEKRLDASTAPINKPPKLRMRIKGIIVSIATLPPPNIVTTTKDSPIRKPIEAPFNHLGS